MKRSQAGIQSLSERSVVRPNNATNLSNRSAMQRLSRPPYTFSFLTLQACVWWNLPKVIELRTAGCLSWSIKNCGGLADSLSQREPCCSGRSYRTCLWRVRTRWYSRSTRTTSFDRPWQTWDGSCRSSSTSPLRQTIRSACRRWPDYERPRLPTRFFAPITKLLFTVNMEISLIFYTLRKEKLCRRIFRRIEGEINYRSFKLNIVALQG